MAGSWLRPSGAPHFPSRLLRGFERIAVPLFHVFNTNNGLKDLGYLFMWYVVHGYVSLCSSRLYEPHHLDVIRDLHAPKGMILVSNHRSFFDMYVTSDLLYDKAPHLMKRLFFPVRKTFFYDNPVGMILNLFVSGGSMWPPIWRDERRKELNPVGFRQIAAVMEQGTVIGIHPEGKRSQLDDPWRQLPAKPGLGKLIDLCDPDVVVLPYFVLGVSNNVIRLVRRNFRRPGNRGEPIRIRFGRPMRVGDLTSSQPDREPTALIAPIMQEIARLAAQDKADWQNREASDRIC